MKVYDTDISGVKLLEPTVYGDDRGFFFESYNERIVGNVIGADVNFVQDNHSFNESGVIRGLHYQLNNPQGKLVRVIRGAILDVVVDMRKSSPSFGKHMTILIDSSSHRQLWVPPGFAHGFQVMSDTAEVLYKMSEYWFPDDEHCLLWNDPSLKIKWSQHHSAVVSKKDWLGKRFIDSAYF